MALEYMHLPVLPIFSYHLSSIHSKYSSNLANYKSFIGSYKMYRENRKCRTADKILNQNIFGYFSDRF